MAKPIAKITVQCPHCQAQQQEPELAKSTFCRRCSEHFAISASTLAGAKSPLPPAAPKLRPTAAAETPAPAPAEPSGGMGLMDRFEHLLGKPKHRVVRCFECEASHEVSSSAHSSTCRACGAYIDLQDYKITGSFSRNIVTRGAIYLSSKGDLSSSKIVCDSAILHGKMRGNMRCLGKLTIRSTGRVPGTLEAVKIVVEKGSDITMARPLRVSQAEIGGKLSAQIFADGQVAILKTGFLEGAVTARGFTVEKGGCFQGELTIGPHETAVVEPVKAEPPRREPRENDAPLLGGEQKPALG